MIGVLALVFAIPLGSAFLWLALVPWKRGNSPSRDPLLDQVIAVPHVLIADEAEGVIDDATAGRADMDSRRCSRQRAVLIRSVQLRSVVRACPGHASRRFFLRIHTFLQ